MVRQEYSIYSGLFSIIQLLDFSKSEYDRMPTHSWHSYKICTAFYIYLHRIYYAY